MEFTFNNSIVPYTNATFIVLRYEYTNPDVLKPLLKKINRIICEEDVIEFFNWIFFYEIEAITEFFIADTLELYRLLGNKDNIIMCFLTFLTLGRWGERPSGYKYTWDGSS